jgi:threonine/homoserine/homoserine lactone efflux protein
MEILKPIINGLVLGISTLLFIGPVLFYLLKASVEGGKRAGISVAAGIVAGDLIYAILVINGLGSFVENPLVQKYMALAGAIVLLFLGLKNFIDSRKEINPEVKLKTISKSSYFLNGFLINFINPFVVVVWIGFLTILNSKFDSPGEVNLSLTIILLVIFSTDILKALFANKLQDFFNPHRLAKFNLIFGIIMFVCGARLLYEFFQL